ncbi:MAG: hypothetical protein KME25_20150 [Symplocastrum torsivum CPER-KK1]|jgi:hypothetical protein|uniref:Uncharacterized protein n=1 Tax=Symplocastrum torsivum CPER-KK1 TaxID=450513 RepID=A0A951UBA5_9CYAN|nr:hypothetical protein [Symplocastrum torsivum CPER-KK1]
MTHSTYSLGNPGDMPYLIRLPVSSSTKLQQQIRYRHGIKNVILFT